MDRQINKFVYKKVIMDGENYMNKKIIQIMLAILLAFALSGCGKGKVQTGENDKYIANII